MSDRKEYQKNIERNICEGCPARKGKVFTAQIRGSTFRGRLIEPGEDFQVDDCVFIVEEFVVAIVKIANTDSSSREQDAEVLTSEFESRLPSCSGPDEATGEGEESFCKPINGACDAFMDINYPPQ